MTTLPPGLTITDYTDYSSVITTNFWLTTTGSDSSTTIVPVILPCPTCQPEIIWNLPEIPWVKFRWPKLPQLPGFHLPCIKIFGVRVAGQCPSPSGPPPVNDDPPPDPQATDEPDPDDEDEDDPCEFDDTVGNCDNGNYPVFDVSTGTINCDVPEDQVDAETSQCQKDIDNNLEAIQDYLSNEQSCCPSSSKAKRRASNGVLSLLQRGLDSVGIDLEKRQDYCPNPNEDPKNPPPNVCYATYTCPHALFPNVCGNAKSAITVRGATRILTHVVGSSLHDTDPWYDSTDFKIRIRFADLFVWQVRWTFHLKSEQQSESRMEA
jgi:hypothetical protein